MKLTTTNIAVMMVALVAISVGGTYALTQNSVDFKGMTPSIPMITGNVKVTHYDGDGNIIGYRQTDNHITAQGMELIMRQVFDDVNGTTGGWDTPPTGVDGVVRWMEIGTAGEWKLLFNDTDLRNNVGGACVRQDSAITNTSSHKHPASTNQPFLCGYNTDTMVGDPTTCFARMNVTAMASFSGMQCSGAADIDEAGIFNDPSSPGGEMFARNTFGGVVLNPPDTLALDWQFTFSDN